ncbi:hypothetical protein AB0H29_16530 [Streptomyces thermolilacinus]
MPTEDSPGLTAKHWQNCTDVYDFLDQVRLRPGMWLRGGSLHDLESMLRGYQVALGVNSINEPCDFWHGGAFSKWLGTRLGGTGPLGWAADIERNTPAGSTPVDEATTMLPKAPDWCSPSLTTNGSRRPAPGPLRSSWTSSQARPGVQPYFAAV